MSDRATSRAMYKGRLGGKARLGYVETDPSGRYGRVSVFFSFILTSSSFFSEWIINFLTNWSDIQNMVIKMRDMIP